MLSAVTALLVVVLLKAVIPIELVWLVGTLLVTGLIAFVLIDINARRYPMPTKPEPSPPEMRRAAVSSGLGVPESGKLGILVDLSHQQDKWKTRSLFELPLKESSLTSLIILPSENLPWHMQGIQEKANFQEGNLSNWRGLVFGIPYHEVISQNVLNAIVNWVWRGGHLILLGYELGERHHRTNLNLLSDRFFGLRFNSDIVAPENWRSPRAKPYGKEIEFDDIDSRKHRAIMKGVQKLCMRNTCTITAEPGAITILPVGKNKVSKETNPNYIDGWTSSGSQDFEIVSEAHWLPVIVEAPQGLCGKGRVIAVGTWDFFGIDECFSSADNYKFVRNLLEWSVDRS